jgi:hypothetical protein
MFFKKKQPNLLLTTLSQEFLILERKYQQLLLRLDTLELQFTALKRKKYPNLENDPPESPTQKNLYPILPQNTNFNKFGGL